MSLERRASLDIKGWDMEKFNLDQYSSNSKIDIYNLATTKKALNRLFQRFEGIFPRFWLNIKSQEHLNRIKDEWFQDFIDEKLTTDEIIQGIAKAKKSDSDYLPKSTTFIAWCREVEPFLDEHQAYMIAYEIMRGEYRDDLTENQITIINHAIKNSDSFFMKQHNAGTVKPVFCRNYEIAIRDFKAGKLKSIPKAIEDKSNLQDDDPWKTLKKYGGILPQYAHLDSYEKAWPVIKQMVKNIEDKLPYDKHKILS